MIAPGISSCGSGDVAGFVSVVDAVYVPSITCISSRAVVSPGNSPRRQIANGTVLDDL